jgi:hypothetical protein
VAQYGALGAAAEYVIRRAGELTFDEAADIYRARATRLLLDGHAADQRALIRAERIARQTRRMSEYERARHAAASAWRGALPEVQGPWLVVGSAIANAAGALVLADVLDPRDFTALVGPWRQAMGTMVAVGPGLPSANLASPLAKGERLGR